MGKEREEGLSTQVKMKEVKLEIEKVVGFDVEINDTDALGSRVGIIAWNEMENSNWQNPSSFENLKLNNKLNISKPPEILQGLYFFV